MTSTTRPIAVRACITSAKRNVNGNIYITAKHITTGRRKRVAYDGALSEQDNHIEVATLLLGARPDTYSSVLGGGYVFTVDPAGAAPDQIDD